MITERYFPTSNTILPLKITLDTYDGSQYLQALPVLIHARNMDEMDDEHLPLMSLNAVYQFDGMIEHGKYVYVFLGVDARRINVSKE